MTLLHLTPLQEILARWNKQSAIPLNIPLLDDLLGGLLPYHLHVVVGDSGAGKTWFCMKSIFRMFQQKSEAQILYNDFGGNFRINNLRKILSSPHEQLEQIVIFQPTSLLEQIIFFRNLLETTKYSFDFIILDSVFGSPLACLEFFRKKPKFWGKKIFAHLLDLQLIAREAKIPILLTNHLISTWESSEKFSSLNQYGGDLIEQFAPIEFLIQKIEQKHLLEVRIFQNVMVKTNFEFLS